MNPTVEHHLVALAPWGRTASMIAIAVALAVLLLAWNSLRHDPVRSRRWTLLGLRAGALAAALVLFFQPALRREDVTRVPNHVAILVDNSESMSLSERAGEPSRAARAAAWIGDQKGAIEAMKREHVVDWYGFGESLAPTTEEAIRTAPNAHAESTRLREALAGLRARYEGRDLAGVVVISDGIDNGRIYAAMQNNSLDQDALDFLKGLDAPVHGAWTGRAGLQDLAIARVAADDFAFVRTAVQVEAVVRVVGAREAGWRGKTVPVTLKRDGVPLKTVEIIVDADKPEQRVAFQFTPERVGKYVYEISAPVLEGEAIVENNARAFLLKVIRDKIRVLQVAGRPSWDERFLRGLLKRDPNVDLISFFILRTPSDLESVPTDELSLIPFPTEELFEEQLRSFDLVVLQNFNYAPYGIGTYLVEIRRYVEEGGGLVMLGGDLSFTLGGYARTAVADVLPVEMVEDAAPEKLVDPQPFRMQLTAEGRAHPVTALRLDLQENERRWAALPDLDGANLIARARAGAVVLGTHPTRKDLDGKPMPVLTVGEAQKGRVLTLASDAGWRWGFSGEPRSYQKLWENAIRWLVRDPSLSLLRVETDQGEYRRGQKVSLTVTALGNDYQPLPNVEVSVAVTQVGGTRPEPVLSKSGKTDEAGELHLEVTPPRPGGYRVTARATILQRPAVEEDVFLVRGAGRELEEPEARDDMLRAVAAATGGGFRGPGASLDGLSFHPPRVVRVNRHRDLELWSGWWTLVVAAACLSANWALRRRWGYA